jgi:NAD-dependent SIR2 family protein deacetylase
LAARKSSTGVQCDICFEPYHILAKWPMIACPNQHFFCDHCLEGLMALNNDEPAPCPICRALIRKSLIRPHVTLFRKINEATTVRDALREESNELFLYAFQY